MQSFSLEHFFSCQVPLGQLIRLYRKYPGQSRNLVHQLIVRLDELNPICYVISWHSVTSYLWNLPIIYLVDVYVYLWNLTFHSSLHFACFGRLTCHSKITLNQMFVCVGKFHHFIVLTQAPGTTIVLCSDPSEITIVNSSLGGGIL